jgi:hypothetical protein
VTRILSFEQAKAQYPHRYTMDHIPAWSRDGLWHPGAGALRFYAPQFRSDREWYDNTLFPGEGHVSRRERYCFTSNQSWPLGQWLPQPFRRP